jgi:uncharacterized small protein (DUF1192 family)
MTGGPRMAIPGAIMFTLAGATGQVISNKLDDLRVKYIFEHEDSWNEKKSQETPKPKPAESIEEEFERRFGFFERIGLLKKPNVEERVKVLRREIERIDGMLKKVDDEIAALEKGAQNENSHN